MASFHEDPRLQRRWDEERHKGNKGPRIAAGGALAGVIAGLVMGMVGMLWSAAMGLGFWQPLKLIAGLFFGVDAITAGAGVIVVGLLVHMAVSALLGALYAGFVKPRTGLGASFVGGLMYGAVIFAFMFWLVLPWANPVLARHWAVYPWAWFAFHLVFGGSLMIAPVLERIMLPEALRPPMREA